MICIECRNDSCNYCRNLYNLLGEKRNPPTKTWCDCQHKTGVILMEKDCHHYRASESNCPTCGKVFDGQSNPESDTSEKPIDLGYMSLPQLVDVEEYNKQTDIEIDQYSEGRVEQARTAVPKRKKKASSS